MESLTINNNPCYTGLSTTISGEGIFMQDNQRQTHWAYIAGVMDSDGCFMITRHKRRTQRKDYPHTVDNWSWTYMASVKICQIEPEAVYFIKNEMGYGTISLYGARPSRPNSKSVYQWGIRNHKEILPFLEGILPYLRIKKNRAEFLLDYCKTAKYIEKGSRYFGLDKDELVYREESYQKMGKLNGRKVAATTKSQGCESTSDSLAS
jgi:hypothetical protein